MKTELHTEWTVADICKGFVIGNRARIKTHGLIKDKDGAIKGKPTYARILIRHSKS